MKFEFLKSALKEEDWIHDAKKEVAFIGRSNVGKSSLINALFDTDVVKVSSTPGRTRMINFFDTDKKIRVVDLPGYGFSKINLETVKLINEEVNKYLNFRKNLSLIILVLDINVITVKDIAMIKQLLQINKPFIIVLNKIDKLAKSYFQNHKKQIANYLEVNEDELYPVSAKNKTNLGAVLKRISEI